MSASFNYPPVRLRPLSQLTYRAVVSGARVLALILGLTLVLSQVGPLRVAGAWLGVICLFHLLIGRSRARADVRFDRRENLVDYCTPETLDLILDATREAVTLQTDAPQLPLLARAVTFPGSRRLLARLGIEARAVQRAAYAAVTRRDSRPALDLRAGTTYLIEQALAPVIDRAVDIARTISLPAITPDLLMVALVEVGDGATRAVCAGFRLEPGFLRSALTTERFRRRLRSGRLLQSLASFTHRPSPRRWRTRAWSSRPTPLLDQRGLDLTALARQEEVGFLIGHGRVLETATTLLERGNLRLLLAGEPGVGRETIVWHLAWRISHDQVPEAFYDYRIIQLNLGELYAAGPREFSQLLLRVLTEATEAGNVILYLPELHELLLSGVRPSPLVTLQPFLVNSTLSLIATTTIQALPRLRQEANLEERFDLIEVPPLLPDEAITLLTLEAALLERQHGVRVTPQAIARTVTLAARFLNRKPLPGSARQVLELAIGTARHQRLRVVAEELIGDTVTRLAGVPASTPTAGEAAQLEKFEERIHERFINQDLAVREVARVLRTYRAGFHQRGPIGTFLFLGPTGVGKTELAKAIAATYFGGEAELTRVDLVAFQNLDDLERLIGSDDGRVLGALTEPVRAKPYTVILLDEFEKAHQKILNLFLPIFDEGTIRDGLGRPIDFTNTIMIATSNAHAALVKEGVERGETIEVIAEQVKARLTEHFPIELINRFDSIVTFRPLGLVELREVVGLLERGFARELSQEFGLGLSLTEAARTELVRRGYDPIYGARPLRRAFEELIKSPLADRFLAGSIGRGQSMLVDFKEVFLFTATNSSGR